MNKAKIKRKIKKNKGYRHYHKKDRYGRRKNNNNMKKILCVFLSFLLIHFSLKLQVPIQIWKNEEEEVEIIDTSIVDDEEMEIVDVPIVEEEENNEADVEKDVKIDTESPRFVMDGRWNVNYTRTYYDVEISGGIISSYGKYWNDEGMRVENNFIQYYDEQYGWVNVYALNVDQLKEYGTVVTSTVLGSIIEVRLPNDSSTHYGIVLDVCGACAKDKKIDVWVLNPYEASKNNTHIDGGVEFRFKRFGFDGETIIYKEEE